MGVVDLQMIFIRLTLSVIQCNCYQILNQGHFLCNSIAKVRNRGKEKLLGQKWLTLKIVKINCCNN
jgi:hypothetical protein